MPALNQTQGVRDQSTFQQTILAGIEAETKRICAEEADAAAERVKQRVRGLYGTIATRLLSETSFRMNGNHLTISVRIKEDGE
jgi:hypothetical protein